MILSRTLILQFFPWTVDHENESKRSERAKITKSFDYQLRAHLEKIY